MRRRELSYTKWRLTISLEIKSNDLRAPEDVIVYYFICYVAEKETIEEITAKHKRSVDWFN